MANKKLKSDWLPARIILAVILLVFLGFALFGKSSGNAIDKPWLADRITGSLFDWIGVLLFIAGIAWIGGLADLISNAAGKGDVYQYGRRGDEWRNVLIGAGLLVAGFFFFWTW